MPYVVSLNSLGFVTSFLPEVTWFSGLLSLVQAG